MISRTDWLFSFCFDMMYPCACIMSFCLASAFTSSAISASRMPDSALSRFSTVAALTLYACSERLRCAPETARHLDR